MIKKINHIGIAVKNIDEAAKVYTEVLGLKVKGIEINTEQKVKTALIPIGETMIELLESIDPEGPIAKFIDAKGEGLHHIAYDVPNVQDALGAMVKKGVTLIDSKPRRGVENSTIAFLHPKSTGKVLTELVEE